MNIKNVEKYFKNCNNHPHLLAYFLLSLLVIIFFYNYLLPSSPMLYGTDTTNAYVFKKFARDEVLQNKSFPLWFTYYYGGMPYIDATHSPQFGLLNILYYILPLHLGINYNFAIYVFLSGIFMFILMREFKVNIFGSLISAISFMFSGWLISHVYVGHLAKISTWAHIPLILYLIEKGVKTRKPLYFALISLAMGNQMLSGHFQMTYYSILAVSSFFIFRIFTEKETSILPKIKAGFKPLLLYIIAVILGVSLFMIQILPAYIYTQQFSDRSGGTDYQFSSSWSEPPEELFGLFIRNPLGWGKDYGDWQFDSQRSKPLVYYWGRMPQRHNGDYLGVFPIILALAAIIFIRNRYIYFFGGLSLISVLLAMGKYTPLYRLAYDYIYGFNFFRAPIVLISLFAFSVSILSGYGAEYLFSAKQKTNKKKIQRLIYILLAFIIIAFILLLSIHFCPEQAISTIKTYVMKNPFLTLETNSTNILYSFFVNIKKGLRIFILLSSVSLLFMVFSLDDKWKGNILRVAVIIFIIFDLWTYNADFIGPIDMNNPASSSVNTKLWAENESIKFLKSDPELFRVLAMERPYSPSSAFALSLHKIFSITGYHNIPLTYYTEYLERGNIFNRMYDLLNLKYLIVPKSLTAKDKELLQKKYELVFDKEVKIFKNKAFLPRVFFVRNYKVIREKEEIFGELESPSSNPQEFVILEEEPDISSLKPANQAKENKIGITKYSPNKIIIEAKVEEDGFLVLSETWYPDWKAFVDGEETRVYKTDYVLRSIFLKKGNHKIEFIYDSLNVKVGLAISLITFVLLILFVVINLTMQNRRDKKITTESAEE